MAISERRNLFIVIIALLVLWYWWPLADLSRVVGLGTGVYGFSSDGSVITRVDRGGPADRDGWRVGDRIALDGNSGSGLANYSLVRGLSARVGDALSFKITSGFQTRRVTLRSEPEDAYLRVLVALRFLLSFLTVGVAIALLLTRPQPATWAFFLYCLCVINLPGAVLSYVFPWSVRAVVNISAALLINASLVGGIVFAWMFSSEAWTRTARVIFGVAIAAAAIGSAFDAYGLVVAPTHAVDVADNAFTVFVLLAMFVGFIESYRREGGAGRQRLKWMIAALLISVPARFIDGWFFPVYLSYGQHVLLISLQAVLPIAAAYAMFRKRVVDINFVISRTLLYGTLTAMLVAIFSLLDALLSHAFAASRVGFGIDITVALVLGFALNAAHGRIDSLIDRLVFRERHQAEQRLARSAAAIVHATEDEAVSSTLVRLPVEVLKLNGAAFYCRTDDAFRRRAADGELARLPNAVDDNDQLVLCLRAELGPLRLEDVPLSQLHASRGPVLALPIAMRGELRAFVIYGAHRNGADIDPDEQRALVPLATNAAIAFDHLDVEALRSRVASLEAMLAATTGAV
ncbi:MAG: hypothetical protein JO165_02065 [Candidatus Eremiobacteraeota bacterium]|nr:hypothetical protein [Candidatus Eremiobacteraeota bacterium]